MAIFGGDIIFDRRLVGSSIYILSKYDDFDFSITYLKIILVIKVMINNIE